MGQTTSYPQHSKTSLTNYRGELAALAGFAAACSTYCVIAKLLLGVKASVLGAFLASQLLVVFLPGLALSMVLLKKLSLLNRVVLAYALGYCANTVEYFACYCCGFHETWLVAGAVAVVSTVCVAKLPRLRDEELSCGDYLTLAIWLVYVMVNVVAYSGNNASPFVNGVGTSIIRDSQFWASNAVALKLGFPPLTAYMDGGVLSYHYFSSLQVAFLSQTTGLSVFSLAFSLFPFGKSVLMVGAANYLADRFDLRSLKVPAVLLLLVTTGFESSARVTFLSHTIVCPFGFDFGFALGMVFLGLLVEQWRAGSLDVRLLLAALLVWAVLVGTKSPIATVLIFASFFMCSVWLLRRRFLQSVLYGLPVLVLFLAVNAVFADAFKFVGGGQAMSVTNLYSQQDVLRYYGDSNLLVNYSKTIATDFFNAQPVLFALVLACSALLLTAAILGRADFGAVTLYLCLLGVYAIGNLLGVFINTGGRSEMYFKMAAFIPGTAFAMGVLGSVGRWFPVSPEAASRALGAPFVLALAFGMYQFCFTAGGYIQNGLVGALNQGYEKISSQFTYPTDNFFGLDEARAAEWVRHNAPGDAVVATDRGAVDGKDGSYYYGIFSERQQYMESGDILVYSSNAAWSSAEEEASRRKGLVAEAFGNDAAALGDLRSEGVDYLICDSRLSPGFDPPSYRAARVFSSGEVAVYELL